MIKSAVTDTMESFRTFELTESARTMQSTEAIYRRHFDMVFRISLSYLKIQADSEDATADVFAKLIAKSVNFQSAEHEKAWLIRTTVNTCKDYLKRRGRVHTDIEECADIQSNDAPLHIDETMKAVMALPPRYKDAIYLYYYEGYTSLEVAGILKKPHSTVRNHLSEARNLLKGVLEDEER